jgi:SagB-type dehydrogenase family enzyme
MPDSLVLSFKRDISLVEESSNYFVLRSHNIQLNFDRPSLGLLAVFGILCTEGATEKELSDLVLEIDGAASLPQFYYHLQQFTSLGLICHTVQTDGFSLATLVPLATPYTLELFEVKLEQQYVLSRFAYCHKDDQKLVLGTPLYPAKIVLDDWRGAAIIAQLVQPQNCYSLTKIPDISENVAQMFLNLLVSAQMLSEVTENERDREQENDMLAQWEFHDLLFHARSRLGRHDRPFGKTYRFLGKIPPLPAVKTQKANEIITLYKPDLQKLKEIDVPFTRVLEQRKSIRTHGEKPITVQQLGEFFYRCARVKDIVTREFIECSDRPYPNGGACYEIEFYPVINTCENISSGLYHYCPQHHQLKKISDRNSYIETLLKNAQNATGEQHLPQILIILTARFSRVSWVYESIAYSLILKHVGIIYQTMYLVATAMNLAPCALGTGNSDLFAKALKINYYGESSVGEFILGSKPKD